MEAAVASARRFTQWGLWFGGAPEPHAPEGFAR